LAAAKIVRITGVEV